MPATLARFSARVSSLADDKKVTIRKSRSNQTMPLSGTALLIALGVTLSVWGGTAAVHGVKHLAHKVFHHKQPKNKSNP